MLAAGTMRFTDAPDTPDTRAGDFDGASFPKQSPRAPPGRDASRENAVAEDDAFRLGEVVRELTTPDAAPEPATRVRGERNFERRNFETYRATRDARGVEDAFEDAEDAFEDAETPSNDATISDATTTSNDAEQDLPFKTLETSKKADDDTPVVNDVPRSDFSSDLSSLREWTRELRAYQRAFALEGVNGESAERSAGAFLRTHLARAGAAVREMVARRDALVAQTRAMPLDARGASAARKCACCASSSSSTPRRLPRSAAWLKRRRAASSSRCAGVRVGVRALPQVQVLGGGVLGGPRGGLRRRRKQARAWRGARRRVRARARPRAPLGAVGSAGAFQTNAFISNGTAANIASGARRLRRLRRGVFEMDGVFRRDGGGQVGGRNRRAPLETRRARTAREGRSRVPTWTRAYREETPTTAPRAAARASSLAPRVGPARPLATSRSIPRRSRGRWRASSTSRRWSPAAKQRWRRTRRATTCARAPPTADAAEERKGARLSGGGDDTGREPDENSGAFVLRLDLATWRAMGGAADELDPESRRSDDGRSDEDEGDAFGFGFGLDDDAKAT